ncbi:ABC transporter domain-containing protein [Citrus sinensis]|uniref:ABC transporter domain-containing protein n=1 Tax=Citrus sinensis TaxID=2711 RepID=A0ACB8IKM3_CITSI|nr:ABC transporter domain-containing protein [Citrus sinensis]
MSPLGDSITETNEALEMESSNKTANSLINVNEDDGVFLTWKDLTVTIVSNGKKGSSSILEDLTGYAKPGHLLAIMGPSGSGKTTLLDALAGRLGSDTRQTGKILINGHKKAMAYGTSAYVTQDDTLITTLTVKEAVYYSAQLQLPDTMPKSDKKERAEVTIREMGLQDAMNTRIRRLSGGQKRRVSISIEILTRPKLLFLDEPTSGLDNGIGRTIIASIHQPSSEVCQLFHNLYLLSAGQTVYFGPATAANEFFAFNGFPCPTHQNPSDHFLKTINKDFQKVQYVFILKEGLADGEIPTEEVINILKRSYKSCGIYEQVGSQVAEICKQNYGTLEKKRKHASFLTQCHVLTRRSFVNMYRDLGYYWFRLAIYISMALGLATLFSNLGTGYRSIQARGSLLMFVASFITFMTIGGFPSFVEDMKVFERERLNGHYGATAFVVGNSFSAVPYLIIVSLVPGAIVYYLPGLHKGYQHFFYFVLLLFACMMLVESLMMIVASLVPNYLLGIITGSGIQGMMILGGGFFQLPNDIPKIFWKYPLYYIVFHKYAYQGMFKNEFEGLKFDNNQDGEQILRDTWQLELGYSKWVDLAILFGMVVVYRLVFLGIIKATEKLKPVVKAFMDVPPKPTTQIIENLEAVAYLPEVKV